jgi:putative acetyltransferase
MEVADPRIAGARRAVQPPSMILRPERPEDEAQIAAVVRAAFRDHGPQVAAFAERIRASENYIRELALVATDDTGVIGHVMLSWVGIDGGARERLLVLTPMSVRPDRQLQGVGRALVEDVLARAQTASEPAVLVEGIPAYYPRFGFEPAGPLGFEKPSPRIPDEAFMVKRLPGWHPSLAGRVVYPPSYDGL